ncbi:toxic anion resistance protein [Solimonas sp. K1W22B-7]|uniref:toxic anion resistance protein n=1 Tax=Solimonas sp. K1W22B-7 TaxID=2303331 RepID=UPI000E33306E|nr:toxic anion resistance protein [Solimonas sp. K1W22B-7]AXQ29931.1 toxic anion resistance protein [Solimonas sp. K1W22B-7]
MSTATAEATDTLVLTPPQPVQAVEPARADQMVKLAPDVLGKLDGEISTFIDAVTRLDPQGEEFQKRVKAVHGAGDAEVAQAASVSNRMLDRPVKAMESGGLSEASGVSRSLLDLRRLVEDLDPSKQGDLFQPRKLLGLIPFGNKLAQYFDRYTSAQSNIQRIITALHNGRDELERDNAAIEEEKINLWNLMQRMEQYVYVLKGLDGKLEAKALELDGSDPARAKILREDVLFYVRQKVTDLLTQTAVNIQGYLALDMIRKTNLELIKGVQRATTTTISALRTAVMVAQALTNQKLVLDQVTALNTTTGNLIEATSQMLKRQASEIHQQAAGSTIEIEKLQRAFQNVYDTMDMMQDFKIKALDGMAKTVQVLTDETKKAKTYLDRARGEQARSAVAEAGLQKVDDGVIRL